MGHVCAEWFDAGQVPRLNARIEAKIGARDTMSISYVLLAAGQSSRMRGEDKLLRPVNGVPLILHLIQEIKQVVSDVIVVVPDLNHPRAQLLSGKGVRCVPCPEASNGQGHSIACGINALDDTCCGVLISPCDLPALTAHDIKLVISEFSSQNHLKVVYHSHQGQIGHPVAFPTFLIGELKNLKGDTGARAILKTTHIEQIAIKSDSTGPFIDLDTPEDWEIWENKNKG